MTDVPNTDASDDALSDFPHASDPDSPLGRVVIAGGSGCLGTSLARHLTGLGARVSVLSRSSPPAGSPWEFRQWDGHTVGDWADALDGASALVNLAGRSVDCVKTPDRVDEILRSRVESTRALGVAATGVETPPRVWVQMSTAHIYGDPPREMMHELSATGHGLAPEVGRAWEQAFRDNAPASVRQVILRTGFVLSRAGGALPRFIRLARLGLGGRVGSGTQGMSWIHRRDMDRIFTRAITDPSMRGTYNAAAPGPVGQGEFMKEVRKAVGMPRVPIALPTPKWLAALGARLVFRTDPDLALYGRYCVPRRLGNEGFQFEFPRLEEALGDLLSAAT
ncbi:MAG: TIGR01777 family oxidoreductase [Phycisphaerales bacterium JB037]